MSASLFGYENNLLDAVLKAGSEEPELEISRITSSHGSPSTGWQTKAGADSALVGANFEVDTGNDHSWRVFLLAGTNLSSAAKVRWRVGPFDAIVMPEPTLEVDFSSGAPVVRYGSGTLGVARTSTAMCCGSDGVWFEVTNNLPRYHFDPATGLFIGLLNEAAGTNRVRNPRFEGMVVPSTHPTNMDVTTAGSISAEWIGFGTLDGIPGAYLHVFGTAGAGGEIRLYLETNAAIALATGFIAIPEVFLSIAEDYGGVAGIAGCFLGIETYTAGAVKLGEFEATAVLNSTDRPGASRRWSRISTSSGATQAFVRPYVRVSVTNGATVDFALWVGGPQTETGTAVPTTPHFPAIGTPAAHVRQTETITFTPTSGLLDPAQGTGYVEATPASGYVTPGTSTGGAILTVDNGTVNERYNVRGGTVNSGTGVVRSDMVVTSAGSVVGTSSSTPSSGYRPVGAMTSLAPFRAAFAYGSGSVDHAAEGVVNAGWLSATLPSALSRMWATGTTSNGANMAIVKWRYYNTRLTPAQLAGLTSLVAEPLNQTPTYDSGWVSVAPQGGGSQSVIVAPPGVSARYARCDIDDPSNPDNFINIPLCYAGPAWQPSVGVAWDSAYDPQSSESILQTRGGQQYVEPMYRRRAWSISMGAIPEGDVWSYQQALDAVASFGINVLFIPNWRSANLQSEAVFGILKSQSPVGYAAQTSKIRTWRARITERL